MTNNAASRTLTRITRVAVHTQRRHWAKASAVWDDQVSGGLRRVIDATLDEVRSAPPLGVVLDAGAGTGILTIPLAADADRVIALDLSESMLAHLKDRAEKAGVTNIETCVSSIEGADVRPGSVDVIVSSYVLHHLRDRDKDQFVRRAATWLRPGGRLVIADVMVGRGATAEDRAILGDKALAMLRRGPGGVWRVAKNALRLLIRTRERPIGVEAWCRLLGAAGFVDVTATRIVAEAALVTGRVPAEDRQPVGEPGHTPVTATGEPATSELSPGTVPIR